MLVRVTDMRGINLKRYSFDTDLTFAVLWMNADGTVYHRYGGRDIRGTGQWLSEASLKAGLQASLKAHQSHKPQPLAKAAEPLLMEQIPSYIKRDKGKCIHCHSVQPALYEEELAAGTWTSDKIWRHVPPSRIGIDLDRDDQQRITAVEPQSAGGRAGLRPGDRLVSVTGHAMATASDLMFALDRFPAGGGDCAIEFLRDGKQEQTALKLAGGWKTGTPLDFSWRPFKWGFTPAPGFGGRQLKRPELLELNLIQADHKGDLPFAFRVTYLVTWGENQRFGQAAAKAGLRKGDIFLSAQRAGSTAQKKPRFASSDHFHTWWRLTRTPGETMEVQILRDGKPQALSIPVIQ